MSTDIRIKKGLSIKLKGVAALQLSASVRSKIFALNPPDFHGIKPKMSVKEGDKVKVGDTVFYGKYSGTELNIDGADYLLMSQTDVLYIA